MENNTNTNTNNGKSNFFSVLYRTRIMVTKNNITIVNLSVLFSVIALLCAPWLVVGGAIVSLVLGYKFAIEHNAEGFEKDFGNVVKDAANNVKQAVEDVTGANHHNDDHNAHSDDSNNAQL